MLPSINIIQRSNEIYYREEIKEILFVMMRSGKLVPSEKVGSTTTLLNKFLKVKMDDEDFEKEDDIDIIMKKKNKNSSELLDSILKNKIQDDFTFSSPQQVIYNE